MLPAAVLKMLELGSASLEASIIALREVACCAVAPRGTVVLFARKLIGLANGIAGAVVLSTLDTGGATLRCGIGADPGALGGAGRGCIVGVAYGI